MPKMTIKEAVKLSGRSEHWLRTHLCSWCDYDLLSALRFGCGAMYDQKCEPAKKNFGDDAMERDRKTEVNVS